MTTATSRQQHPPKRSRGGTQPQPLSRGDIVDAALPLLAEHGIDGLTLRMVADALGVSSPAVYHYFSGREALLDHLCERVAAEVDITVTSSLSWDDAVVAIVLSMNDTFARYAGVATRVLPAQRPSPAADRVSMAIREQVLAGGFTTDRADDLLASLHFLFGGWLLGTRPLAIEASTDPALLERATRWLLHGFAAG